MASAVGSIDELISVLVSMGFAFEDAQLAAQFGKLSVEEAVAWIVQGKPGAATRDQPSGAGPSLRLTREQSGDVVGSNPFTNPQPLTQSPDSGQSGETSQSEQEMGVTSRLAMKEEQRVIKNRFEEKQREEARKKAKLEKAAQKKAKAQVLKEIQEDRERQKMRRGMQGESSSSSSAVPAASQQESPTKTAPSTETPKTTADKATLQVRLPDGQVYRHQFQASTLFKEVMEQIRRDLNFQNFSLLQAFPRRDFTTEDVMNCSLSELKLVPSGSLLLRQDKPKDTNVTTAQESVPDTGSTQQSSVAVSPDVLQNLPQEEEQMSPDEMSEGEDQPGGGMALGGAMGGMGGPMGGMGGPMGGMGGAFGGMENLAHIWGEGQRLTGQPWDAVPDTMPHHERSAAQMAAQMAQRRQQDVQVMDTAESEASVPSLHQHQVPQLASLLVQHLSMRLSDPAQPVFSLSGLPNSVAVLILEHLKKKGLLRPKVLQLFVPCHLSRINLDFYKYTTNELLMALRLHRDLTHISLASCPLITDKGLEPLKALKRLRVLNLSSCQKITDLAIPTISCFTSLVTLLLEDTKVTDEGIKQLAAAELSQLQSLNLSRTAVTQQIFVYLIGLPYLRILNLEQTQVSSLSGVQSLSHLESLNLCATNIVTESLMCLSSLSTLRNLNIGKISNLQGDMALCYIEDIKLHHLQLPIRHTTTDEGITYIQGMPLQALDLTNYVNIGDASMSKIGRMMTLKQLMLSNTKVTDEGLQLLAGLSNLEVLYLDRTRITDDGAAVIGGFEMLLELSLSETLISNTFLKTKVLNRCLMLSKLSLSRTQVSGSGLQYLRLPNLALLNMDGTRLREHRDVDLSGCPKLTTISRKNLQDRQDSSDDDDM